jgi:archaemetzincin
LKLQPEYTIAVSPIGDLDATLLQRVKRDIEQVFGCPVEFHPLLEDVGFALDAARHQYHSTEILERLDALAPPNALKVLAIVQVDLFIPILTHVFGEAQLGGRSCVVSTHRLQEEISLVGGFKTFCQRVSKESVHELGHTFDLRHCRERSCIMHYCRTLKDVDRKSDQLCRYCTVLLRDELKKIPAPP